SPRCSVNNSSTADNCSIDWLPAMCCVRLAAQNRATPVIERALAMRPVFHRPVVDHFKLGRHLDPVAVGIRDEDEEIVAWPVSARSPHQWNFHRSEAVTPVADSNPFSRLIAVMIDALAVRFEAGERVMLMVGSHEAGRSLPLVVDHAIRDEKAEFVGIEILNSGDIEGREREVLQRRM